MGVGSLPAWIPLARSVLQAEADELRARKARESIYVLGGALFTPDGGVDEDAVTELLDAIERKWGLTARDAQPDPGRLPE